MAQKVDIEKLSPAERAIIEARRAYKRAWRAANQDKVRAAERRFYEKKAVEKARQEN